MKQILIFIFFLTTQLTLAQNCVGPGHSANKNDSWFTCSPSENPNPDRADSYWVLYDLGFDYHLSSSHIWNYNVAGETENGMKLVSIDYSSDGINWTELGVLNLQEATGSFEYEGEEGLEFNGIACRYILITSLETWGGSCAGLSEVRFDISQTSVFTKDVYVDDDCIELYPNPTEDFFTIDGNLSNYNITVVDVTGNPFMTLTGQSSPVTIDISLLPAGIYFITLSHHTNPNLYVRKILKQGS